MAVSLQVRCLHTAVPLYYCYWALLLLAAGYGYVYFFHVLWGLSFQYTLLLANFLAAALAFTFFKVTNYPYAVTALCSVSHASSVVKLHVAFRSGMQVHKQATSNNTYYSSRTNMRYCFATLLARERLQ
jgi:hypothetical protein